MPSKMLVSSIRTLAVLVSICWMVGMASASTGSDRGTIVIGVEPGAAWGTLVIDVEPASAEIEFDGGKIAAGSTLLDSVPVGWHLIRVFGSGYEDQKKEVFVLPDRESKLHISLTRVDEPTGLSETGSILVKANRSMRVYVDGVYAGSGKNIIVTDLDPGTHEVSVKCKSCAWNPGPDVVEVSSADTTVVSMNSIPRWVALGALYCLTFLIAYTLFN